MIFAGVIRSVQGGFDTNAKFFGSEAVPSLTVVLELRADKEAAERLLALLRDSTVVHVTFEVPVQI